jgi:hypothetical protein
MACPYSIKIPQTVTSHPVLRKPASVSVWFVVAAVSDRRRLIQEIPAVRDRRYSKLRHYRKPASPDFSPRFCKGHVLS